MTNAVPVIGASDGQQIDESTRFDLTFDFTDPGIIDTHTATIDWGDGTPVSVGTVVEANGSGTVSATHIYEANGIYFIQVSVEDNDGAVGTETIRSIVAGLGDLTRNGYVDFQDLTLLLANWNQDVTVRQGNLVEPETTPVNFADLTVLLANWTGPGPGALPQPTATEATVQPDTPTDEAHAATSAHFNRLGRRDDVTLRRTERRVELRISRVDPLRRLQATAVDRALAEESTPDRERIFRRRAGSSARH